jgi:uncharacterized protein (DUF488 family)
MKIFTIGFTQKSAEQFFEKLKNNGVSRVVDTRLNNVSQLAGFTKRDDLRYFLRQMVRADYTHLPILAPTKDILDEYKKKGGDWSSYETKFNSLIESRHIEDRLKADELDGACLLCSEPTPHHCHRRLVAEYLQQHWGGIQIVHL